MQFKIEQIALHPRDPEKAKQLLSDMGLADWTEDTVNAIGHVFQNVANNQADLSFNYDAAAEGLELEVLHYTEGKNWMQYYEASVSHLGMHCTAEELEEWKLFFISRGIFIAQEVHTQKHTNPYLVENGRKYNYCIFDTRRILGVDIKMIVRIDR